MAITPRINFPTDQPGFSTNLKYQTLRGTADTSTKYIEVNGSMSGVSYVTGATGWSFVTTLVEGINNFQVIAEDSVGLFSPPDIIDISYTPNEDLNLIVSVDTVKVFAAGLVVILVQAALCSAKVVGL